jgi:Lysozyme inhibitor LprI
MNSMASIAALSLLLLADTAWAQAKPTTADLKAVQACLERQEQNLGAKCIGIVADPCIAAAGNDAAKEKACAARELAVWDREMVSELKRVNAGGFKEIINAAAQAQRTWQSSHRKLCAVFDKVEPGMLLGAATYCRMHETAARVLVLRRLGDAVNEH